MIKYMALIILAILFVVGSWYLFMILLIIVVAFFGAKFITFITKVWDESRSV